MSKSQEYTGIYMPLNLVQLAKTNESKRINQDHHITIVHVSKLWTHLTQLPPINEMSEVWLAHLSNLSQKSGSRLREHRGYILPTSEVIGPPYRSDNLTNPDHSNSQERHPDLTNLKLQKPTLTRKEWNSTKLQPNPSRKFRS